MAKAPQDQTAIEVYQQVLLAQKKQASFQCDIIREEKRKDGAASSVTGTLKVASGGRAWLEIGQPSRQLAVSDGKKLWVQLDDVKQVMQYDALQLRKGGNFFLDLGSSIQHYAEASLKRLIVPGEGFDVSRTAALELMPLHPDEAGFESMRVWVDRENWLVKQVELKLGGVDTRVRFENPKLVTKAEAQSGQKKPLEASEFRYKPPQGYQVFDLAGMQ
jgi:outer membrane lipoprotein-sorting protein